jgi:hypothetical protein
LNVPIANRCEPRRYWLSLIATLKSRWYNDPQPRPSRLMAEYIRQPHGGVPAEHIRGEARPGSQE